MGNKRTLRQARSVEIARAVSRAARGESCAARITRARAVEALWSAFRARTGIDRAHRAHVCGAGHQSPAANTTDPRAKPRHEKYAGLIQKWSCLRSGRWITLSRW